MNDDDRPPTVTDHSLRVQRTVLAWVAPGLLVLVLALLGTMYHANETRADHLSANVQDILLHLSSISDTQVNNKQINAAQDTNLAQLRSVQENHEHRITIIESSLFGSPSKRRNQ